MMGICSSSLMSGSKKGHPTAILVDFQGGLQEFRHPIKASSILSHNKHCFICSSDAMLVGSPAPRVAGDEELQRGQIYFLLPDSKSHHPLSLQDLCALAVKTSTALNNSVTGRAAAKASSISNKGGIGFPAGSPMPYKYSALEPGQRR
ncbi:hypothetical protein NMG60_11015370 [Bertholletia excelsa]